MLIVFMQLFCSFEKFQSTKWGEREYQVTPELSFGVLSAISQFSVFSVVIGI